CRNTAVDDDWVNEMIHVRQSGPLQQTRTFIHLIRGARNLFEADELERILPRLRGGPRLSEMNGEGLAGLDPIAATEAVAYDFLSKGGKHSRPFTTLAVYDALTGGHGTMGDGAEFVASIPDSIRRTAMSIETFHKASLVHDDIEDDDEFRYGEETLHRKYGIPTAVNVGDYLIGMGYRFVSREAPELGSAVAADILDSLAQAHTRLSEGQGAELLWRDALNKELAPIDALKIYALKTSPAFEAALLAGIRLARPIGDLAEPIKLFARNLGVAFQILNDLGDWLGDDDNKLAAGLDTLGGRPTILLALALDALDGEDRQLLLSLLDEESGNEEERVEQVRHLYSQAGVFEKAMRLVDKHQQRAEMIADDMQPEDFRRLLYYLIDTVLERQVDEPAELVTLEPLASTDAVS
ncbi:MAG: polyprenyl synthetase family protein, partial [Pirellulaceae bacterium]